MYHIVLSSFLFGRKNLNKNNEIVDKNPHKSFLCKTKRSFDAFGKTENRLLDEPISIRSTVDQQKKITNNNRKFESVDKKNFMNQVIVFIVHEKSFGLNLNCKIMQMSFWPNNICAF